MVVLSDFMLTEELKNEIDNAKQKFKTTVKDLDLDYVHFRKFGKNFIKSQKLSPDSYMQLAIQVYHRKITYTNDYFSIERRENPAINFVFWNNSFSTYVCASSVHNLLFPLYRFP